MPRKSVAIFRKYLGKFVSLKILMANRLRLETSPYLLQHAHNPVDWYPWGEAAFERAKQEQKPVLVSIGYAACHWCHVMEHESFEDEAVAALMNEHFICIKVDREEHPDVDHLYMDALQAMSGSGGWPLNMFVTPDKEPFYGGTYFPPKPLYGRSSWTEILHAIRQAWTQKPEEVNLQAKQMVAHLQQAAIPGEAGSNATPFSEDDIHEMAAQLMRQADSVSGGFGGAPKFPATMSLQFLLSYAYTYRKTKPEVAAQAREHVLFSLDRMIAGGIYDQIAGGFARYATDKDWLVPHFEKMLYDNALLICLLCDAWKVSQKEAYKQVIADTIAFCVRELAAPDGPGFFSALDADSEGVEGKFYTWSYEAWQEALPDVHPAIQAWWGVRPEGNWEATNILHRAAQRTSLLEMYQLTEIEFESMLQEAAARLMQVRSRRMRPATDDKLLLSWNALMNEALQQASVVLDQPDLLQHAVAHMDWMLHAFVAPDETLCHVLCKGRLRIPAKLDDYAFLIHALLRLSSATGDTSYILQASTLCEAVAQHFSDASGSFFYYSSATQQDILVRKTELYDGATPAANAVMQQNLNWLGYLMERPQWIAQAEDMLAAMKGAARRYPSSFGYWARLLLESVVEQRQLVISGDGAAAAGRDWQDLYQPFVFQISLSRAITDVPALQQKYEPGPLKYYLCRQFSCHAPVSDREQVMAQLGI